jgi:hypothetical protein
MSNREPHLWEYLAQEEWKTCFALAFVETTEYAPAINLRQYHVEGKEGTWESGIIAAVRFLCLEHNVRFEAVAVREEDREILVSRRDAVEPRNMLYLKLLAMGKLPDIPLALQTAVRLLNERAPSFNTDPLEAASADVEAARRQALATADPEGLVETESLLDRSLAIIGVVRNRKFNNGRGILN